MTCKGWRNKYEVEEEGRSPEVNGNSCLGKRRRSRSKKQCGYLQEWLDKSYAFQQQSDGPYGYDDEPVHRVPGLRPTSCWPNHPTVPILDRRLFPTASEPAMCRYSVPVGYSLEPISLPVYAAYVPMPESGSTRRRNNRPPSRSNGGFSAPPPTNSNWHSRKDGRRQPARTHAAMDAGGNDDFTSLPPAASSHTPDTVRRRFSDPGIGSCSRASTPEPVAGSNNALVLSLVEQVNALQDSNKQLYQELRETKAELEALKQSWRQMPPEYEPGMLSDLVREIRDAARVREEVLLSRVCSMLDESGKKSANHVVNLPEKLPVTSPKLGNIEEHLEQLYIN
ncbi:hypothetical protein L9F63_008719, partial [Diploptera punctata]